ncbi:MAG: hypothetical protein ACI85F_001269, partial [Bacteroidia bacterium]
MDLILEYPTWFLLLAAIAGVLAGFGLYWKNQSIA